MNVRISDGNIILTINPLYPTKEEWVYSNVSILSNGLNFCESIEFHYSDFHSLYSVFETIEHERNLSWSSIEEKFSIEISNDNNEYLCTINYNIDDYRQNFIHIVIRLYESDIRIITKELSSITNWMEMR